MSLPRRNSRAASAMCTSASPRSNSYMPEWNMPATRKRRMRGTTPVGVAVPSGAISTTLSPTPHVELVGERAAEDDAVAARA